MLICNLHWRCSVLWRTFSSCWTTRWRSTFIACSARTFATHYWGRWNGRGSVTRRAQNEIMMWVFERWENGGCDKRMINVTSLKAIFYVLSLNDIPVKAIGLITIQLSFASVIVFCDETNDKICWLALTFKLPWRSNIDWLLYDNCSLRLCFCWLSWKKMIKA